MYCFGILSRELGEKMKILVFSQYYYPEQFLINELSERLVSDGNEITVVTGLPNYPSGVIPKEYRGGKKRSENINGVKVLRCSIIGRGKNRITLLINYFSYMISATFMAYRLSNDYDVVLLYQLTPILQAYPAIKYAEKNKKKLVCYCGDLAPASGSQLIKKYNMISKLYFQFSKWAYTNSYKIGVTSKAFIDYLINVHGIAERRLFYLPQHAPEGLANLDLEKKGNGIFEFMFAGNLGAGASLETILYAANILKVKGRVFKVHFIGDGSMRQKLLELTEKLQLNDVIVFHQPVLMSEMGKVYKTVDALLVTLRKGQITVPSKLQTYMATGKPIFGAMDGSGKGLINEANCGRCVEAEDFKGLAKIMDDYLINSENYKELGFNGRRYFIQNFTLDKIVDLWQQKLQEVMEADKGD